MFKHYLLSLIYYKKRTFLSVLGILIGVAILVIVLSLGGSLKEYLNSQMESFGPKILFINPKAPGLDKMSSIIAQFGGVEITTLKEKDLKDLKKIPYVEAVNGAVNTNGWLRYKNNEKNVMILGLYPEYQEIDKSFKLVQGRMFQDSENNSLSKVVVIGYQLKEELFGNENPIGKRIKIGNQSFKVIGVLKKRGSVFFVDLDSLVFVPAKTLAKVVLGIDYFSEIDLKVTDLSKIDLVKKITNQILLKNHHIKDPEKKDFQIMTSEETIKRISQVNLIVNILLGLLASISLIVGGIGIMNMMLISVKERTKEIGLRKAVGARKIDIFYQFLIETLVVTLVGALLGFIFAFLFIILIFLILRGIGLNWPFSLSVFSFVIGLFFAIVDGLLSGLLPAYQASKLDPVEALRS